MANKVQKPATKPAAKPVAKKPTPKPKTKSAIKAAPKAAPRAASKARGGKNAPKAVPKTSVAKAPTKAKPKTTSKTVKPRPARKPATEAQAPSGIKAPQAPQQGAPQMLPGGPEEVLGQVAWLMMSSPTHKHLFITDLEWLVLPAIQLKQFRIFRQKKVPVAFATWAFLSEEVEQRLASGTHKLKPGEWNSGDQVWLIDLVAPFGGAEDILKTLADKVFPGRQVKTIQPNPDGKGVRVVELKR